MFILGNSTLKRYLFLGGLPFVSTFFTDSHGAEVIFGDEYGPYLPSTENFSELKYEILTTALKFLYKIYIKSIGYSLQKMLISDVYKNVELGFEALQKHMEGAVSSRNNEYYFFITDTAMNSNDALALSCRCGASTIWEPPHDMANAYCKSCGSTFNFMALSGDPGYIFTSDGPVRVIGSSQPAIEDMSEEERTLLFAQWQKIMSE